MKPTKISKKAIYRLCGYYRILRAMESSGKENVQSGELGEIINCAASQVRQDISHFGCFGTMGKGYEPAALRTQIGNILGVERGFTAIVIGVGRLGSYMLEHELLREAGFEVVSGFDISPAVIGRAVNAVTVRDIGELDAYLKEHRVDAAALCIPGYSAQSAADILRANGVNAIWNLSGYDLSLPRDTIEEAVNLSDSFLSLSCRLAARRALEDRRAKPAQPRVEKAKIWDIEYFYSEPAYHMSHPRL